MEISLPRVADAVTVLVGIALLVALPTSLLREDPLSPNLLEASVVGERIDPLGEVDFSTTTRSLVMVLQSDCVFCQESMPFYRRLVAADRSDAQIVVVAPPRDAGIIGDYLASEGVTPDSVVFVGSGVLPISGTPTLLLVDRDGVVTNAWIGLLSEEREAEVTDALFD